jgi:hypothetical protein
MWYISDLSEDPQDPMNTLEGIIRGGIDFTDPRFGEYEVSYFYGVHCTRDYLLAYV